MDLVNILINPDKTKTFCCLCYTRSEKTTGLHDGIEIHDENFDFKSTLWNIMKSLFPSHDIILPHMCEDCSTLILKIFRLLQRSYFKNENLNTLVNNLDEEVDEMDYKLVCGSKPKICKLFTYKPANKSFRSSKNCENFQCEKCLMKFKSKFLIRKHIQIAHKNTNNAIICDVCGKLFTKNSSLKGHLGCHEQKQCPYCFKVLKSHSHFNVHLNSHESQTKIKIKRKFKHHNCSHCDYRSLSKSTLDAHINKVHLNVKPFACEICQKGFYKKDHLTQHLETHNKKKSKICYICGDMFRIEKTLQIHLKSHSGEAPFKCGICDTGFITSGRRQEHIKRKHMEKTECCLVCGKKFSLKKDLNTHLKKVHGAETDNFLYRNSSDNNLSSFEVVKVINCKK